MALANLCGGNLVFELATVHHILIRVKKLCISFFFGKYDLLAAIIVKDAESKFYVLLVVERMKGPERKFV